MSPRYDRHADQSLDHDALDPVVGEVIDDEDMEAAAEALRAVEVEATQPEPDVPPAGTLNAAQLEVMNIDELRAVAKQLDIPDRATITEKDELLAEILQRL